MTKFLYLLSVIIFYISNNIECSKLFDVLQSYYKNGAQENFANSWQIYHKAFETEIASNLQENFGRKAVNIHEPDRRDAHLIAGGFHLTDGVVMVYFFEMVLRELPSLLRPQLDMELSSNRVKFNSKVGQMFIDTTYYVARNSSSVIYARPEDQKELSPFSLQQVDNLGKVAIVVDDCTLSGLSIATLSGDSVNLGHNTFMLSDCKFTVEISTPNSGAPPVIAPYFSMGPKEKLELVLSKPLRNELHTKLQGAMYTYINMTVLLGSKAAEFRKSQQELFKTYNEFATTYVRDLNQKTLKENKGHVKLPNYEILMNTETDKRRWQCHMALRDLNLYGLDTAYIARTGGPYAHLDENNYPGGPGTRLKPLDNAADAIMFSSMQIRGKITHDDGKGSVTHDFATELTDVKVKIVLDITKRTAMMQDILLTGWRSLEFSIIPWETKYKERHGYQSLVYGHILNELPVRVIDHLRSILGASIEGSKQDDYGAGDGDASNHNDASEGNDAGNDKERIDENGSVADNDEGKTGKDNKIKGKKDGFFSDDLLDDNFFSDEKFLSDDGIEKDFITDDGIEKDFITDDGIEKDFITDDGIEKDFITDDGIEKDFIKDDHVKEDFLTDFEAKNKNNDGKSIANGDAAVDDNVANEAVDDDDGKDMADAVAENAEDPGGIGDGVDEEAVADDTIGNEGVNDNSNPNVGAENAEDPGTGVGVDDEEVADDTVGNEGVSDGSNPNIGADNAEDPGGIGDGVDEDAVADDTIGNEGVNDDSNPNVGAENAEDPGTGVGVDDEEVADDIIGNEGVNDNDGKFVSDVDADANAKVSTVSNEGVNDDDGKVSDDVGIAPEVPETVVIQTDGPDVGVDDEAVEDNEENKNVKGDSFLSEGFIENDFFSDDNIKEDFISDISVQDNDNNSPLVKNEKKPSIDNDAVEDGDKGAVEDGDEGAVEDGDEGAVKEDDDGDGRQINVAGAKHEKQTGGDDDSVLDNDFIEKDFMSDFNMEENFFSDDNLEKDFISDDNTNLRKDVGNNKLLAGKGKGNQINTAGITGMGNKVNRASGSAEDNNGEISDNASVNDNVDKTTADSGNKKMWVFASNENKFDRRSMADDSQRADAKTKDNTNVKSPKYGEDDHMDGKLAATIELDDRKPVKNNNNAKVENSQKVHNPALPSNVHNTRRHRNMHMSENEIR